jgi:cytochrome b pre-mRNA-processing protein 3
MISLHLALLFRRLRGENKQAREFSQAVFDLFFKDMDRSLREMGVSDLGVPQKIEKMGDVFYGTLAHVNGAIDAGGRDGLAAVLLRNIHGDEAGGTHGAQADALADYLLRQAGALERQPASALTGGTISWENAA